MQVRVRPLRQGRAAPVRNRTGSPSRVLPLSRSHGGDGTTDPGEPLVRIRDLKVWFPLRHGLLRELVGGKTTWVRAVDGASFDIRRGEVFCLVGESGCGKTTTGKAILRLNEPTHGSIFFEAPPEQWDRFVAREQRLAELEPIVARLSPADRNRAA